ncbi:MAG TPA: hypothetical protein VG317_13735 [Pseudonocardiaceae bacterium]|nr:hypothetical protein [Pseudonocardiaceae bacterium]
MVTQITVVTVGKGRHHPGGWPPLRQRLSTFQRTVFRRLTIRLAPFWPSGLPIF